MSLRSRVARLERESGIGGPCQTCGGYGRCVMLVEDRRRGAKPTAMHEPKGCSECGKIGHVKRLVVVDRAPAARQTGDGRSPTVSAANTWSTHTKPDEGTEAHER